VADSAPRRTPPQAPGGRPSPPPQGRVDPALLPSVRKLSSTMPGVAAEGAKELGESGHAEAVPPLLAALRSRHRSVDFAAVAALLRLGPLSVGPLRDELAAERDAELRGMMARLLEQLERTARGLEPAPLEDIVGMAGEVRDELARGWTAD
jgi:hypothetical protein